MASISVDQDQFSCPVCLDLLKDPVTIPCGHSFCMVCINGCWDQDDQKGVYSCPQCRETFIPRPVLCESVSAAAERTEKQRQLKELHEESQRRIQEKEKKLQELKQAVNTLKSSAQTAVEDSERIFTELICFIEKKRSEVTELIRSQEKAELSRAEKLIEHLEQEIADLKRRDTELEQLSHTEDHIQFLQSFQSLCVSSGSEDSPNITVTQHLSFDKVNKSLSDLKKQLEEFLEETINIISPHATAVQALLSEPKTREDFLQYYVQMTLDPNTAYTDLSLSEKNRVVRRSETVQPYSDHPERFDYWYQVLSKESVSGRCYWEVECSSPDWVGVSVSYKGISRKGSSNESALGLNDQSWNLSCTSILSIRHNNIETKISAPPRIGVYVDHSAGTLSFYSVSGTMTILHTVRTTFTQPLHAGFWLPFVGTTVTLCNPE